MIAVTDLQKKPHIINAEFIERVETTPDTQIVLTSGQRIYVSESPERIAELVIAYRRACLTPLPPKHKKRRKKKRSASAQRKGKA